jgi:hypothetical protein
MLISFEAQAQPPPLETLIIDETKTLEESFCVEALARQMVSTGFFSLDARLEIPWERNTSGRQYDLIVIVPEEIQQVWLVTPDLPEKLPAPLPIALSQIKEMTTRIYGADGPCMRRTAVDVSEDLAPALYSTVLLQYGWLRAPI